MQIYINKKSTFELQAPSCKRNIINKNDLGAYIVIIYVKHFSQKQKADTHYNVAEIKIAIFAKLAKIEKLAQNICGLKFLESFYRRIVCPKVRLCEGSIVRLSEGSTFRKCCLYLVCRCLKFRRRGDFMVLNAF